MIKERALVQRYPVGLSTTVAVSRMRMPGPQISHELLAGSVSRGTCALARGTRECLKKGCQAPEAYRNARKDCADRNMRGVFDWLDLLTEQRLVVGTRNDRTGFYDEAAIKWRNGFRETESDYAAFFARVGDGVAIATHMADCGFAAVEFPGVFGFIHLTRLNMSLPAPRHFLNYALAHYGGRLDEVRIRLISGITAQNFPQRFADVDGSRPEDRFPGWFHKGLLRNRSRPLWMPGDPIDPADVWEADNREMMRRLLLATGIDEHQLTMQEVIDPGDLTTGHASHSHGMRGHIDVARDAYIIAPRALVARTSTPTSGSNSTGVATKERPKTATSVELRQG